MTERFTARWDVRTGSPRRMWRALHDLMEDLQFEHTYDQLGLEDSPIEGTATFSDYLVGYRDSTERASLSLVRIVLGVVLCLTLLLSPVGIKLIKSSTRHVRTWATLGVEGEVYRVRGANVGGSRAAEVLDVAADARITLEINGAIPELENPEELTAAEPSSLSTLYSDFQELEAGVAALLPTQTLPSTDVLS